MLTWTEKENPEKRSTEGCVLRKVKSGDEERVTHRCHWSLQRSLRHYGGAARLWHGVRRRRVREFLRETFELSFVVADGEATADMDVADYCMR